MHSEIGLVDVIFRICIFSLLGYKLYSLIKAYFIPFLVEQIALEKKQQSELLSKEKLLISTQHRLKNQIFTQKQMFILLERNVQIWHKATMDANHQQEQENQEVIQSLKEKRELQAEKMILYTTINESIPVAVEQARQQLTTLYQAEEGKALLNKVIAQLGSQPQHNTK